MPGGWNSSVESRILIILVLMPGVGAQGGDAEYILSVFGDNVIANVGRAIMYAHDPVREAVKYRDMLNGLRN